MPKLTGLLPLFLMSTVICGCAAKSATPEIVDFFACSDLCTKPMHEYIVKVYEGVEDRDECLALNGVPRTLVGWGTQNYCMVPETEDDDDT